MPSGTGERPAITVETLEGLVDVAIDTNNRVIEHLSGEEYVVFVEDRLYRYEPPADPATDDDRSESGRDEQDALADRAEPETVDPSQVQANHTERDAPTDD